jgi:hypothetical protein
MLIDEPNATKSSIEHTLPRKEQPYKDSELPNLTKDLTESPEPI